MSDVLVYICCTFLNSWFLFLFFFLYSTATEQLRNLHNPISARFYICTQFTRLHCHIPSELAIELSPSQEQPSSTSIHPNCHLLRPNPIHTPPQTRSSKHQSNLLTPTQSPTNPPNYSPQCPPAATPAPAPALAPAAPPSSQPAAATPTPPTPKTHHPAALLVTPRLLLCIIASANHAMMGGRALRMMMRDTIRGVSMSRRMRGVEVGMLRLLGEDDEVGKMG